MGRTRKNKEIEGDGEDFVSLNLSSETKRTLFAIFLFLLALIFALGFFKMAGLVGEKLTDFVGKIFGWGKYLTPFVLMISGIILVRKKTTIFYVTKIIGTLVVFLSILALFHIFYDVKDFLEIAENGEGGGYIGYFLAGFILKMAGKLAGIIVLITTFLIGLIITYNISFADVKKKIPTEKSEQLLGMFKRKKEENDDEENLENAESYNDEDNYNENPFNNNFAENKIESKKNDFNNNYFGEKENRPNFEASKFKDFEQENLNYKYNEEENYKKPENVTENLWKDFDDFDDFKEDYLNDNLNKFNEKNFFDDDANFKREEDRVKIIEKRSLKNDFDLYNDSNNLNSFNDSNNYLTENYSNSFDKEKNDLENLEENNLKNNFTRKHLDEKVNNFNENKINNLEKVKITKKEIKKQKSWQLPPFNLMEESIGKAQGGDVKKNAQTIKDTLSYFGINVELDNITTGPTVTRYSFRPPTGVKLSKIISLNADLALALAAHPIRIEAPIPGKSLVGIEVPNKSNVAVRMRDLVRSQLFKNSQAMLPLALGKDINGELIIADLAKMPHLLVAGATGTGKSVTINSILISLLYHNSPENLKLILVDPKRVELSLYNGIPHLLSDVIVDNDKVINALKWAISEMERRYKLLQETGSRDLKSYNEKKKSGEMRIFKDLETGENVTEEMENLPMIVIVMDELADLMASNGKEVEGAIVRLAQMSRAIGIHLIVSTQRPSVEVITGLIKANLPTRIALRVATGIDSRTILDTLGAEKLIGYGDMLFMAPNSISAQRLQGVFVEENEVKRVVDFIKNQKFDFEDDLSENFKSSEEVKITRPNSSGISSVNFDSVENSDEFSDEDPLYAEAKDLVIKAGKASTSYIQRRLRVGYARAARLIDILEENGVVSPADGSRPRQVLTGEKKSSSNLDYENPEDEQMKRDNWQM